MNRNFLYFLLGLGTKDSSVADLDYRELHQEIRDFSRVLIEEYGMNISPLEVRRAIYSENVFATEYFLEIMLGKKEAHHLLLQKDESGKHILEAAISLGHIPLVLAFYRAQVLDHFLDEPLSSGEYLLTALFTMIGLGKDDRENELLIHLIEQLIEKIPERKLAKHYLSLFMKSDKGSYWTSVGLALFLGQEDLDKELSRLFPGFSLATLLTRKQEYLKKEEIHLQALVAKMRQKVAPIFESSPIYQEFLKATELEDAFFATKQVEPLSHFHISSPDALKHTIAEL